MDKVYVKEMEDSFENSDEYAQAAAEWIDNYCEQLGKEPGMQIPASEHDGEVDDHWQYVWADKASKLIEKEVDHYYKIGRQYWSEEEGHDIDIWQHLTQYKEL